MSKCALSPSALAALVDDDRILWGIVANAGRCSTRRTMRWVHVMDAIGMGSNSSIELCRRFGFDPDEQVGTLAEANDEHADEACTCPSGDGSLRWPCVVHPPLSPLHGKYAEVLVPFLHMMDRELHANAGKGDRPGWLSMDRKTALLEIFHHQAKLQRAALNDDTAGIREYAADVANMSMMLVDVCGALVAASTEAT